MPQELETDLFAPTTARQVRSLTGARPFRFGCTACGKCCRGPGSVYFTRADLENIYAALGLESAAEKKALRDRLVQDRRNGYYIHRTEKACTLLDKQGRCSVYEARPLQCRTYPFWPSVFADEGWYEEVLEECPGTMGRKGQEYSHAETARIVNRVRRSFLAPQKNPERRFMI